MLRMEYILPLGADGRGHVEVSEPFLNVAVKINVF